MLWYLLDTHVFLLHFSFKFVTSKTVYVLDVKMKAWGKSFGTILDFNVFTNERQYLLSFFNRISWPYTSKFNISWLISRQDFLTKMTIWYVNSRKISETKLWQNYISEHFFKKKFEIETSDHAIYMHVWT